MQILITARRDGCCSFQTSSFGAALQQSQPLLVKSVVNGDTIDVATVGRVRLLGIDAPAAGRGAATPAPFGREALDRLTSLVLNRWVRLEREGKAGVSSRHQAYVITGDGLFVNAALVREGLARVSARTAVTRLAELQRAEAEARAARRGIWGSAAPVPPRVILRRLAPFVPRRRGARKTQDGRSSPEHPCRVRLAAQDPRAQQAVLPVQPLADLDIRVLHRAGAAHLRSVRARLRHADGALARRGAHRHRHRRAARRAARRGAEAVHHPLHRGSAQSALPPRLLHVRLERGDHVRGAEHCRPRRRHRHRQLVLEARCTATATSRWPERSGCSVAWASCRA